MRDQGGGAEFYRRSELARAADAGLRPSDDRRRPALQSGQCETDRRDPSFKAREGRPRIPLGDAPATFRQLSALASASSGLARTALEAWLLMIATAARPSEALEARWQEVNLDKKLWTLPAARTKSSREHVAPLNSIALAVLERQARVRSGDAVFGGRSGSPLAQRLRHCADESRNRRGVSARLA